MIHYHCHTALERIFKSSVEGEKNLLSTIDCAVISDFLPQDSRGGHAGLLRSVKYRLFNPSHDILIASFYSKEALVRYDSFGILSLPGTEFIQLPFSKDQIIDFLKKIQGKELKMDQQEWELFAQNTCNVLLSEQLSVIKHGFISKILFPLRVEACNCIYDLARINCLRKILQRVNDYMNTDEIVELVKLSQNCANMNGPLIDDVHSFIELLNYLRSLKDQESIDCESLRDKLGNF